MKFRVVCQPTSNPARSAFRIVEQTTSHEAGQDAIAHHRASVGGGGRAVLVQLSDFA
jgi:hypothetical protein